MRFFSSRLLIAIFVLALLGVARAHPGHEHPAWEVDEFEDEASMSVVVQPFAGIDPLLAMLVLGALLAAAVRCYPAMTIRPAGATAGLLFPK